jgi:pimeloyl-ACP methyl ester carboxylesterase
VSSGHTIPKAVFVVWYGLIFEGRSFYEALRCARALNNLVMLPCRLSEAAHAGTLPPVLIIHGDADRLVPVSNSLRLSKSLPGSELAVVGECGE